MLWERRFMFLESVWYLDEDDVTAGQTLSRKICDPGDIKDDERSWRSSLLNVNRRERRE
jgi:hypothetical protein